MSNNSAVQNHQIQGATPGKLLAEKRKKLGLDEREVADALKISVSRLKSIEADDFSVFPSETYIKGHLKNYCRLIKYDEQEVMEFYGRIREDSLPPELAEVTEDVGASQASQKHWWSVYIVLLVLALLWVMSYWMLEMKDHPESSLFSHRQVNPSTEQPVAEESPLSDVELTSPQVDTSTTLVESDASVAPQAEVPAPEVVAAESVAEPVPESVSPSEVVEPIVVSKLTAAELAQAIQGGTEQDETVGSGEASEQVAQEVSSHEEHILKFDFTNPSWVQVIDATGAVLFKGLNKAGAELALNGVAPFKIVIGNVDGTSLVYNGEQVDLVAPSGKNILRLTLGG